ncbi:hypothetical protein AAGT00_01040 (plasmid) [Streptomyces cavourensis]
MVTPGEPTNPKQDSRDVSQSEGQTHPQRHHVTSSLSVELVDGGLRRGAEGGQRGVLEVADLAPADEGDGAAVAADGEQVELVRDTLLCDRFLLVDGKLKPVLEVRYKRSRHATRPASAKDTLGTEDMEGRPFYEPTQELSFVRNLTRGRFAAVLVPTAVSSAWRWQLFAHNDEVPPRCGDG